MKPIVELALKQINEDVLFVDASKHPQICKGIIVSMFKSAGFYLDNTYNAFIAKETNIKKDGLYNLNKRLSKYGYTIFDEVGIIRTVEEIFQNIKEERKLIKIGKDIKDNPTLTKLVIPGFKRQLMDFQIPIVKHNIAVKNGANFSCPGSGKTTMIYAVYSYWKNNRVVEKMLVICPINAFEAWETEYYGCFEKEPNVFRLNGRNRDFGYINSGNIELFTINHATLSNDISKLKALLKKHNFMVILDESHYIKSFSNNAIWANAAIEISKYAKVRLISSGTPSPNGEIDFWSQFTFLVGGEHVFGNRIKFIEELKSSHHKKEVMKIVNSLSHRVTKNDLKLPEYRIIKVPVQMSQIQENLYNMISDRINDEVILMSNHDSKTYMAWRKAKMIRLRQISSNPGLLKDSISDHMNDLNDVIINKISDYYSYEISSKMQKTVELATKFINEGKRVLIWSEFVDNIKKLSEIFKENGITVFNVYGEIPKDATEEVGDQLTREGQIANFKECNGSILISNPQTMAESVSLHRECHIAIYMDRSFNCAHWMQSKDRIHRVGLPNDIITKYYIIENENSIDEVIDLRLEEKELCMNEVLRSDNPYAVCEFNGKDFGEDEDFKAVLSHIKNITKVGK